MTIGMLVESLTSKVGALNGHFVDATPFQKCEKPDEFVNPVEEFGNRLEMAGFAKHGGKSPNVLACFSLVVGTNDAGTQLGNSTCCLDTQDAQEADFELRNICTCNVCCNAAY